MKKLLCLAMCFLMLFSFVACGGSGNDTDADANNGGSTGIAATSIKFAKTDYSVGIGEEIDLSSEITVEPKDADVVFSVSNDDYAVVSGKGVVSGEGVGKVTLTAASKDGSVKATCKVDVYGFGSISCTGESSPNLNDNKIVCKRPGTPEFTHDGGAIIILVSKKATPDTDYANLINLKSGAFSENYDGYHIAQSADGNCSYKLENIPTGDYYGIIISRFEYKTLIGRAKSRVDYYKTRNIPDQLKAKGLGSVLSDDAMNAIATIAKENEFCVKEITIEHEVDKTFAALFYADTTSIETKDQPYLGLSIDEFKDQMK